jgi:hypothetical protein
MLVRLMSKMANRTGSLGRGRRVVMPNCTRRRTEDQQHGHQDRKIGDSNLIVTLQNHSKLPRNLKLHPTPRLNGTPRKRKRLQSNEKLTLVCSSAQTLDLNVKPLP